MSDQAAETAQAKLYRIWCSVEGCVRYGKFTSGLDGPILCGRHARIVRHASRSKYLATLLATPPGRSSEAEAQ